MEAKRRLQDVPLEGEVLLIDAITSNPGAPGGALVASDGRLAGMIGKVVESKSTNTRINYAIPSDLLYDFVHGIELPAVPGTTPTGNVANTHTSGGGAAVLGIKLFTLGGKNAPAYVDRVVPASPAGKAGLKKDDLILRIGNDWVRSCKEYEELTAKLEAGAEVSILIKRKVSNKDEVLTVTLTPEAAAAAGRAPAPTTQAKTP
jgi:serine protease Do